MQPLEGKLAGESHASAAAGQSSDRGDLPPEVSVVLPAYNEEEAIGQVLDDIRRVMDQTGRSYEILVIDDASDDATAEVALQRGVRVITKPFQGGSGASRKVGIMRARGRHIVMLDADGTYTPEDIPALLKYLPAYDQVNGVRDSEQGTMMPLRWLVKKILTIISSFAAGRWIPDVNTGLKAFKREIMIGYIWAIPDGFSCVTSMTLAFLCNGHTVKFVPCHYRKRVGKSKFHPIWDSWRFLVTIFRVLTYFNPLRPALVIFFSLAVWGVIKSIYDWYSIKMLQKADIIILVAATLFLVGGVLAQLAVSAAKAGTWRGLARSVDPMELDSHPTSDECVE